LQKKKADSLYFIVNKYNEAALIYQDLLYKNPNNRYANLMENFCKPYKEQFFIKVPKDTVVLSDNYGYDVEIIVDSFKLSPYEVTNVQFARFLNEYGSFKVIKNENYGQLMININGKLGVEKSRIYLENGIYKVEPGFEFHPVIYVSWYGANEFCKFYNLRLPTEAEWELAASYGHNNRLKFSGTNLDSSLTEFAWYLDNSANGIKGIGLKKPNVIGLFDMTGNVWEWCSSWSITYNKEYLNFTESDTDFQKKVFRGGSFNDLNDNCLVNKRNRGLKNFINNNLGFRVVLP